MLAGAGTGAPPLAPEQERHHCILRGGGMWELVAGTNCVVAARERSICVGAARCYKYNAHKLKLTGSTG